MRATRSVICSLLRPVLEYMEAYSQTACRPAKPLVRVHLRKAVNKVHGKAQLSIDCVGIAVLKQDVVYRMSFIGGTGISSFVCRFRMRFGCR